MELKTKNLNRRCGVGLRLQFRHSSVYGEMTKKRKFKT